jgi:hypothetical protein
MRNSLLTVRERQVASNILAVNANLSQCIALYIVHNDDLIFPFSDLKRQLGIWDFQTGSITVSPITHTISHPPWSLQPTSIVSNSYTGRVKLGECVSAT